MPGAHHIDTLGKNHLVFSSPLALFGWDVDDFPQGWYLGQVFTTLFVFRWKTLEGPLHDATVPPQGDGRLLWPRCVPLLRGWRDPAQPTSALRPLQGPFRGAASGPRLRTQVPRGGLTGRRGRGAAQENPESGASPVFPEQHHLEAVAAAVLWNLPSVRV